MCQIAKETVLDFPQVLENIVCLLASLAYGLLPVQTEGRFLIFDCLASPALWLEYEAVLKREEMLDLLGFSAEQLYDILRGLAGSVEPVTSHFLCRPQLKDPKDEIAMSQVALRLPDSLHQYAKRMAAEDDASLNQFIVMAVAKKISAYKTEALFWERAALGSAGQVICRHKRSSFLRSQAALRTSTCRLKPCRLAHKGCLL